MLEPTYCTLLLIDGPPPTLVDVERAVRTCGWEISALCVLRSCDAPIPDGLELEFLEPPTNILARQRLILGVEAVIFIEPLTMSLSRGELGRFARGEHRLMYSYHPELFPRETGENDHCGESRRSVDLGRASCGAQLPLARDWRDLGSR